MAALFSNNLSGNLNGTIDATVTSITLSTGTGVNFPSPTGGDYFLLTLAGLDVEGQETSWEIVKVTARTGDVLTVERGYESSVAASWISGSRLELRMTAGQAVLFEDKYSKAEVDTALDGKVDDAQVLTDVPAGAVFTDTDTVYNHPATHPWSAIDTTPTTLAGYGITDGGGSFSVDDIENASALSGSLASSDEFLVSDSGVLKKADMSDIGTYLENNGNFFAGGENNTQNAGYLLVENNIPFYIGTSGYGNLYSDGADIFLDLGSSYDFVISDGGTQRYRFADSGNFLMYSGNLDVQSGDYLVNGVNLTTGFNKFEVVVSLPGSPDSNTIYFVTG
jgi:hypothetical protein